MEYYFLFKFPILWIIFRRIEVIMKVIEGIKEPEYAADRIVLRNFLLIFWILLVVTILM